MIIKDLNDVMSYVNGGFCCFISSSELNRTVSKMSSASSLYPPMTYIESLTTAAPEYPRNSFIGSPSIHVPVRGSNISTLGTIVDPSNPPIAYLQIKTTSNILTKFSLLIVKADAKYKQNVLRLHFALILNENLGKKCYFY